MPPLDKPGRPRPRPRPKPPRPKPKPLIPVHGRPSPEQERDGIPPGGVPFLRRPVACATNRPCPPSPKATVHLRLPTPFIALSSVLLLALLVRWLVRRRRREPEVLPPLAQDDEESVQGVDAMTGGVVLGEEDDGEGEGEDDEVDDDGGVHHVWYIRTKGLDERAIAAIAAVVYDAATKRGSGGGACAVCLAEFRDGETLRLLPRCRHAFHRGCIDPWLRAHVNCPLCRAPVQATSADLGAGAPTEEAVPPERAATRAASVTTLPRPVACPDASLRAPASSSGREEDMTEVAKITRLLCLEFSDASDMPSVGAGGSVSFGAGNCQRLPTRSGSSTAAGGDVEEIE